MGLFRLFARILGWLLTPLVAWAASFCGAWVGAGIASRLADATTGLGLTVGIGAVTAIAATIGWMRLLRRSPQLREALAVTEEGVPVAVLHEGKKEEE